jgi:hypothetical protein
VVLLLVVVIVKSLSVVIAGDSAASAFTERDNAGLRRAVDSLTVLNVIEPAKAYFAAGGLAVLDNRLEEADRQFSESLARTEPAESCAARVNLQLVRETLGDRAAAVLDGRTAVTQYVSARTVVEQAPQGCAASTRRSTPRRLHRRRLHPRPRRAPRLHHRHRRNQEGLRLRRTRNCASNPAHRWSNFSRYFATPRRKPTARSATRATVEARGGMSRRACRRYCQDAIPPCEG